MAIIKHQVEQLNKMSEFVAMAIRTDDNGVDKDRAKRGKFEVICGSHECWLSNSWRKE